MRAEIWTNANSLSNFSEDNLVWSYSASSKPTLGHFKTKQSRQKEPMNIT